MSRDVFLSHSSKDKATADAVCTALEAAGIRCWIAPRDIPPGADWGEALVAAIGYCPIMVLIFSSNANASSHVHREVKIAVDVNATIIPMRIEQDVIPTKSLVFFLTGLQILEIIPLTTVCEKASFGGKEKPNAPPSQSQPGSRVFGSRVL
jgi:TIR domain